MSKSKHTRPLLWKKPALSSMGWETMLAEIEAIMEQCDDVAYYANDMDTLISALDGEEEEALEFRMAFSDLAAKADRLYAALWEWRDCQRYDDCTVALIGNRYELVGYDTIDEDYYALCRWDTQLAVTEAGKRLMRHTKAELLSMVGQAVGMLLSFVDLRQQYDYLKATMDILTDNNRSVLRQIRELEQLYERVGGTAYPLREDVEAFDRMAALLPERMWIE